MSKCICSGAGLRWALAAGLVMVVFAAYLPAVAEAAHGVTIGKTCESPKRTCLDNSDCTDGDVCNGLETCDLTIGNTTSCEILIEHADTFGDTIRILDAWDVVDPGGSPTVIPAGATPPDGAGANDLPITSVSGNTTCTVGGSLPCLIGPAGSTLEGLPGTAGPGQVVFLSDEYAIQPTDPNPLGDQGSVRVTDLCNVATSGCSTTANSVQFTASTDLVDGCQEGTPLDCDDNDLCTTEICDPVSGCVYTDIECDDNNLCTTDTCEPGTGCVFTPTDCDDNDACTTEICDPASGCVYTEVQCDDNDACTTEICDPVSGCVYTDVECDDNNLCTTDSCDPASGCINTPIDCDDNDVCTLDNCDPASGCVYTDVVCDDNDICTDDSCDPVSGCQYVFDPTNDPSCGNEEICRTPGFWGTHGGTEKDSQNITQAVIDHAGGCLEVCGDIINTTAVNDADSALEAMCVRVRGNKKLQLVRQLTAAALNCVMSGGGAACTGVSVEDVFLACNDACADGDLVAEVNSEMVDCVSALDCFNNGGIFDIETGECGDGGPENCHERELCNEDIGLCIEPPHPASSSDACHSARMNSCEVFGGGEANCEAGSDTGESCGP